MHRTLLAPALAGLLLGAACATPQPPAATDRTAVLVAINDVYRIEGVENGNVGGLARVRALRAELEKDHPDLVMLHAGDILFPSFASRMLEGEQMIAGLNGLDGDTAAFDERMFAIFGNHEFDKGKLKHAPMLDRRIEESQFRWLAGNVRFAKGADGKPLIDAPNLEPGRIVESGGIRLGIFGVTIPTLGIEYVEDFDGPQATVRRLTADLRARGAEVVIAVTHLNADDDRAILEKLPVPEGPDLIIGGHDHEHMAIAIRAGAALDRRIGRDRRCACRSDRGARVYEKRSPLRIRGNSEPFRYGGCVVQKPQVLPRLSPGYEEEEKTREANPEGEELNVPVDVAPELVAAEASKFVESLADRLRYPLLALDVSRRKGLCGLLEGTLGFPQERDCQAHRE